MATTASETKVQELYIAYFGRPADPAGLAFYADALDAASTTVEAIATSFAASTEAATIVALGTDAYLSAVYLQAFGRAYVEGTDGTFWKDAINNAATTKELAMVQILEGASGTDTTAVANKVTVAKTYTAAVTADSKDYSSTADAAAAKAVLDAVTEDAATVTSGNTAAQTAVDDLSNASAGVGSSFVLKDTADTIFGTAMDDTITATADGANGGTFNGADVVADSSTVDNDTLTIASTAALHSSETATVVGIENVVINQTSFAEAEADLSGFSASSVTINQLQAGAAATAALTNASGKVTLGTGITSTTTVGQTAASDLTVNLGSATTTVVTGGTTGDLVINAGSATTAITGAATTGSVTLNGGAATTNATATAVTTGTATATGAALTAIVLQGATQNATTEAAASTIGITGTAGASDVATVSIGAASALTIGSAIETLNISTSTAGSSASIATINGTDTVVTGYNLTGANSITVAGNEASFDGKTLTDSTTAGTTTVSLTTVAASDLRKVAADVISLDAAGAGVTLQLAANQTVATTAANTGSITLDIDDGDTTYTDAALTLNLGVAHTSGNGFTVAANSATADNITTLNVDNSVVAQTALALLATATADVVMTGSKAVVLEGTSTAKSLNASAMTAGVTVTVDGTADIVSITTGSGADTLAQSAAASAATTVNAGAGNDTLTAVTLSDVTYDGGTGTDTVSVTTDMSDLTLSNIEVLDLAGNVTVAESDQFSGQTFAVTSAGAKTIAFGTGTDLNLATVDLSNLVLNNITSFTMNASGGLSNASFLASQGLTYTGSTTIDIITGTANADIISTGAGADIIVAGAGADTITAGEGADTVTGGLGADVIDLTEVTAAVDNVIITSGLTADTITAFTTGATAGDKIQLDISALEAAGAIEAAKSIDLVTMVDGATAITGTGVVQEIADQAGGAAVAAGAGADIFVLLDETYADLSALETGLETGDHELTVHADAAVNDAFIVVWSDGTDSHVSSVSIANDGTDFVAADLIATDLAVIKATGVISAGEFVTGNFDIV